MTGPKTQQKLGPTAKPARIWTEERDAKLEELWDDASLSLDELARAVGVSRESARQRGYGYLSLGPRPDMETGGTASHSQREFTPDYCAALDERFVRAMMHAISAKKENATYGIDTRPCTRSPVYVAHGAPIVIGRGSAAAACLDE